VSEHSPLPWSIRPHDYDDWGWIRAANGDLACVAKGDRSDTWFAHREAGTDPAQANADLIVNSVNLLPELVMALEAALQAVEYSIEMGGTDPGGVLLQALNKIDVALAKARASASPTANSR